MKSIITRIANLGHKRIDYELIRRVRMIKEAGYCDEIRVGADPAFVASQSSRQGVSPLRASIGAKG